MQAESDKRRFTADKIFGKVRNRLEKYDLRFTALFYQNLMSAVDYIENTLKNPAAADRLISKAESEINKRLDYPLAFQPYPLKKRA